jgi:predicted alpha-1,2-mannosidase
MGGDEAFAAKLDAMFESSSDMPVMWLDVTGLLGQYAQGNEPCHHMAFLYNYAGAAWKTQERIRHVMTALYTNTVDGLCGNDDCGQMSAWYIWSAAGLYPVDPMSGVYVIGSPLADRVAFRVKDGKTFTIMARNNSTENKYIQSATLNGQPLTRSWISHDELEAGGELAFVMGPQPNKTWGAAPQDRPPSPVWSDAK